MIRPFFISRICCDPPFAELKFDETRREVISNLEGEILKVEFPFHSDGSDTVKISRYLSEKLEGGKTVYAAGESGKRFLPKWIRSNSSISLRSDWESGSGEKPINRLHAYDSGDRV